MFSPLTVLCQENKAVTEKLKGKYGFVCYHDNNGGWYSVNKVSYGEQGGACDVNGREVIPPIWDYVSFWGTYYKVEKNGFVGIRDLSNREIVPCSRYTKIQWHQKDDYSGYCEVEINGKKGVIDNNNKEVIPCKYDDISIHQLNDGSVCEVIIGDKIGVYDVVQGRELLSCNKYTDIRWYQKKDYNGYCEVEISGKKGVIDKNNREVIPCKYDGINIYSLKEDGSACEVKISDKVGIYDITIGQELIPCRKYTEIRWYQKKDNNGYCQVLVGDRMGIIDRNNIEVIPCNKYTEVRWFQIENYGGFCEVLIGKKAGLIDKKGKEVIPCRYDAVTIHELKENNWCRVKLNGKEGVYDIAEGKELIPCNKYTEVRWYQKKDERGYCEVLIDKATGIIDRNNKEVIPCGKYDLIRFMGDYALVEKNAQVISDYYKVGGSWIPDRYEKHGLWGLVDLTTGNEMVPCKYHYLKSARERLLTYNVKGTLQNKIGVDPVGGKWGCIDLSGKEVISAVYDNPISFEDGVAQVSRNGVASLIPHPVKGSSMALGHENSYVDVDIPISPKANENVFAFVVSNENYNSFSGADFSIHDGKIFAEYCEKTLGVPEKNIKRFEDATYGNIVSVMSKVKDIAEVYEGDATIIFYYSGLGMQSEKTKEQYIMPVDATKQSFETTGYMVRQLMEDLGRLNTRMTLAIIDAPFSGVDRNGKTITEDRGVRITPKPVDVVGNNMILVKSISDSYASSKYSHGLLTYSILEKLKKSKGICNMEDLFNNASSWVKKESLTSFGKVQSVEIKSSASNRQLMKNKF